MSEFILALAAVFIAAGALLLFANHFGLPPVPFYIIAGIGTGLFVEQAELIEMALWGVAFLVFVFGTRIDFADVSMVFRDSELAAFTQLLIVAPVAFGCGFIIGDVFGFDDPIRNGIYFSAAATLSSTLVVSNTLQQEIRNNLVHGRLAASVHLFDDFVAIGALLVLSAEVLTDPQIITSKIGYGVLFIVTGILIYQYGYSLLLRAANGSDELILMGSISILIGFLAAAELADISIVVGAFAAGIAVRTEGGESLGVRNGIESIKDFFVAIFFVTIGALVTVPTVDVVILAAVLILLVVIVNPIIHTSAFVLEGYDGRTGFLAASSLNQVSELALVIAIQAWILETIAPALFDAIILAAAITMILSSITGRYDMQVYEATISSILPERTSYITDRSNVSDDLSDHVVIVGYGRHGRHLVRKLEELSVDYVVIENDPVVHRDLRIECEHYVFGDAMASYPLTLSRIDQAQLVISTVDHRPVSDRTLEVSTDADVIVRTSSSAEAIEFLDAGATFVIVPSILAADQLTETIERVLADGEEVDTLVQEHRKYLTLVELAGIERRFTGR